MNAHPTWIDHFPENFASVQCHARYEGHGAVRRGCAGGDRAHRRRFRKRRDDPDAWWQEWSAMAAAIEMRADDAAARGRSSRPATTIFARATTTSRPIAPCRRVSANSSSIARRCSASMRGSSGATRRWSASMCRTRTPRFRRIFCRPRSHPGRRRRVVFDGIDNCKEMSVLFAGLEFARRGCNTLRSTGRGRAKHCGCGRYTAATITRSPDRRL